MGKKNAISASKGEKRNLLQFFNAQTDTNKLLIITILVFVIMYIGAIVFEGAGFLKPQAFCNILINNAALIITSCGMSVVMITGGIDISNKKK